MKKELKEKFEQAEHCPEELSVFDTLYIIELRKKHDSGYQLFKVIGESKNKYYLLSYSDVIDFSKIYDKYNDYERIVSIDFPDYRVIRIFIRYGFKFLIPFKHCSSFEIRITDRGEA